MMEAYIQLTMLDFWPRFSVKILETVIKHVLPSNRQGQWGIMLAAAFVQLLRKVVPLVIKVQHLGIPHEERKRA